MLKSRTSGNGLSQPPSGLLHGLTPFFNFKRPGSMRHTWIYIQTISAIPISAYFSDHLFIRSDFGDSFVAVRYAGDFDN